MPPFLQQQNGTSASYTGDDIVNWLIDHGVVILGIAVFVIVAIFALNLFVPRLVRVATEQRLKGKPEEEIRQRTETLTHVFTRSGSVLLIVMGFFTSLPELGVNIAPLLAGAGIVGIALGFGAQSLVRDYLSGIFILIDNQYGKGDVVRIADISGLVEDIGLRRTVLRDLDGVVHYIPNGEVHVASNFSQEFSRVNLNVSVSYAEDLDHVIKVLNEVGEEMMADPEWRPALLSPPHVLRVDNLGDSGIDIKVVGDTQPLRQWDVMGELRKRIKKRFDEEGIEIPFPHRVTVTTAKAAMVQPPQSSEGAEGTGSDTA
jgi:small conductance mechanosensitive channel